MAQLHFMYGTMGASKSAALIINAYNFKNNGVKTQVIKPAFDTRFGTDSVVSRIGISVEAHAVPNLNDFSVIPGTRVLLVDEVQFFSPADVDKMVDIADNQGVIVMCYGLMTDSNEEIFPASRRLIEVGAKLRELKSNCQIPGCLKLATHHLRFDENGNVVRAGQQMQLGADRFKSVCRTHFNCLYHGIEQKTK